MSKVKRKASNKKKGKKRQKFNKYQYWMKVSSKIYDFI